MRRCSAILLALLIPPGCASPGEDPGRGPGGKADDGTASAGAPLVTCRRDGDAVRCSLEPTRAPMRINRVLVGPEFALQQLGNPEGACETSGDDCPEVTLDLIEPGDDISARITFEGLESAPYANLVATLPYPGSSSPSRVELPYDLWSVRFTRLDEAGVNYLFRYPLTGDGVVGFIGGVQEIEHFAGLKLEGDAISRELQLPVTPGSNGPQGLLADITVTGEPHFSLAQPGCYVVLEGGPPILDEGCAQTSELVDLTEEDSDGGGDEGEDGGGEGCACDVEDGCDAGCECDGDCAPSETICVSGTRFQCDDPGETWNDDDETCCVEGVATCESGTQFQCDDEGEHWTGEVCCLEDVVQCVAGTPFQCDDEGEHWTGEVCCLEDAVQCVAGTPFQCDDEGEHWTGELCCVTSAASCEEGSSFSCEGSWTGELCCE